MYKIRFYYLTGVNKGNLKYEEFFNTKEELKKRYEEVFEYNLFSLNPTMWELKNNEWFRIMNYELF